MDFSAPEAARTYSDRQVDQSWISWCLSELHPTGKDVVDIGCGGGIYTAAFLASGAKSAIGIDSSPQYIEVAKSTCPSACFHVSQCDATGLENSTADLVYERALIHHLEAATLVANAHEMFRLLRVGGLSIVQDRTADDALAEDDRYWIRRELFRMFPRLCEYEASRRPVADEYTLILEAAGFAAVEVASLSETRRVYASRGELADELTKRKGKSILFQLRDDELARYVDTIMTMSPSHNIVECDRWTIWKALKSA